MQHTYRLSSEEMISFFSNESLIVDQGLQPEAGFTYG
jgi:hypothetical protein